MLTIWAEFSLAELCWGGGVGWEGGALEKKIRWYAMIDLLEGVGSFEGPLAETGPSVVLYHLHEEGGRVCGLVVVHRVPG